MSAHCFGVNLVSTCCLSALVDSIFYTVITPHKKWISPFRISSFCLQHKQPLGGVLRKEMLLKFENMKGDDDKNNQKLRLLGFSLFHIQRVDVQVLLNPWDILVK